MRLKIDFSENNSQMCVRFIERSCTFKADFGEVMLVRDVDVYEGDYEVTPRVYVQELETKDKLLTDNITIFEIPKATVLNPKNGYTVTIG